MNSWLPNALTLSRVVLLLPILWLFESSDPLALWAAFVLFLVAAVTDGFDGWCARRFHAESNIGIFLDPLADKIFANLLTLSIAARYPQWIPMWAALLLLAREFAVQGFRSMAPCVGVVLRTGQLNKWKLVLQLIAIGAVLPGLAWEAAATSLRLLTWAAFGLALIAGYWSMLELFWINRDLWRRHAVEMELR